MGLDPGYKNSCMQLSHLYKAMLRFVYSVFNVCYLLIITYINTIKFLNIALQINKYFITFATYGVSRLANFVDKLNARWKLVEGRTL